MTSTALPESPGPGPIPTLVTQFDPREPIPGYRVEERIGAGGYGEVWRASAPGQIAKAVKIVYGCRDDQRAQRELASLNRIKAVGHPFLLSIERIELIDGHLVIVTELASSSLKQLFDQCRASGLPGIPRETLLEHLRDVADALDYICQQHSLQHLDVKPENLLLIGGRVKVADFGLVKDLQDVQSSIVGGLTPVYAAPELFDGRPNDRSDQYSLAIVYQDLLTGALPFEGRTTAQLAAQHLHSKPRLDSLPLADQATIARALAKQPSARFASCRELIDRLVDPAAIRRAPASLVSKAPAPAVLPSTSMTEVLTPEALKAAGAAEVATVGIPVAQTMVVEPPAEPEDLPPVELSGSQVEYRPTVVVGLGGLGAQTLLALQRRLTDRFCDPRQVPAVQLLLLETDPLSVKTATDAEQPAPLENDAVLLLPLRQPSEYRRESGAQFSWLSRRWIFNIPRSLATEGFRPLGRLALADHSQRVAQRLTQALEIASHDESLAHSRERSGLAFQKGAPRVFVVASMAGGTGSGMVLDLGYLVRQTLRELDLPEGGICGLLAHGAGRTARARDLATANSYACLTELAHFADPAVTFPGDASCGLEAGSPGEGPFDQTYLVQLGEELDGEGFTAGIEQLAEFIYQNTLAPAAAFFDGCRAESVASTGEQTNEPLIRTFGLCPVGLTGQAIKHAVVDRLCEQLLDRWRRPGRPEPNQAQPSLAEPDKLLAPQFAAELSDEELRRQVLAHCDQAGLDIDSLAPRLQALALGELGAEMEPYLVRVLEDLAANYRSRAGSAEATLPAAVIVETLDSLVRTEAVGKHSAVCLESALEARLKAMSAEVGAVLEGWVLELVSSPAHRLEGAQRAAGCLVQHLRALGRQAQELLEAPRSRRRAIEEQLLHTADGRRAWLERRGWAWKRRMVPDRQLLELFRLKIDELAINGVNRLTALVTAHLTALDDKLRNLSADLNRLSEEFARAARAADALPLGGLQGADDLCSGEGLALLVDAMQTTLAEELASLVAQPPTYVRGSLPRILRRAARSTLMHALKQQAVQSVVAPGRGAAPDSGRTLTATVRAANPRLSGCGGKRRTLLTAPDGVLPEGFAERLGAEYLQPPTQIVHEEEDVLLCCEVAGIRLRRAAAQILSGRYHNVEAAKRLHTRVDVRWNPL